MPDTKSAAWVQATRANSGWHHYSEDENEGSAKAGNAWLLSEKNGVVELLFTNGTTANGRRASKQNSEQSKPAESDEFTIKPAKLDDDLKSFAQKLKAKPTRNNRDDEESGGNPTAAGASLLFLAQLQRHGEKAFVRDNLPAVLAMMDSPSAALSSALDLIANSRISELPARWHKDGDASAYAKNLEAIAATFTRGWSGRDAALFLAKRLAEQKPAPTASDAEAKVAADLLLSMTAEEMKWLPRGNWFLPTDENSENSDQIEPSTEGDAPPQKKEANPNRVSAFFGKTRNAAIALAKLLGDQRFLRSELDSRNRNESSYSFADEKTPEMKLKEAYDRLPRPRELGELAMTLLSAILPDDVTDSEGNAAAKHAAISAWVANAAKLTDEQLAWEILKSADRTYDNEFRTGLGFLVKNGGPETMVKLKDVFFDPGVWTSGNDGDASSTSPRI